MGSCAPGPCPARRPWMLCTMPNAGESNARPGKQYLRLSLLGAGMMVIAQSVRLDRHNLAPNSK